MGDDEYWDPDVDQFLLECVREQLQNSSKINFGLITEQFLEIIGEETVTEDAVQRFSPYELCQRWMDLHSRDQSQQYYYSHAGVERRDRVVDAMQNFLLGLPSYYPQPPPDNPQDAVEDDALEMAFCAFEHSPSRDKYERLLSLEERALDNELLFSQLRLLTPLLDCAAGRETLVEASRQRRREWNGGLSESASDLGVE